MPAELPLPRNLDPRQRERDPGVVAPSWRELPAREQWAEVRAMLNEYADDKRGRQVTPPRYRPQ